ncbi:MAG TPA: F0F1 ATP synthase subunit B [Epulopiscium sp.]|nr:F0F1 ATP synthase subunit B [Candidatus Epulonipiscium sp.]
MNPQYVVLGAVEVTSRIIEFSPRTVFEWAVMLFNFFLIVGILSWLLFKPVSKFLNDRITRIKNQIDDAKGQNMKATQLRSQYETKLAAIEQEATEILRNARSKAKQNEQEIIQAARLEAEEIRKRSRIEIGLEKERVKDEMKKEMIEVATMMASQFVAANIDDAKQNEMINQIINEAGDVQWLS